MYARKVTKEQATRYEIKVLGNQERKRARETARKQAGNYAKNDKNIVKNVYKNTWNALGRNIRKKVASRWEGRVQKIARDEERSFEKSSI